jgi:hypothetical protein
MPVDRSRGTYFEIAGDLTDVETISVGSSIRDLRKLRRLYGGKRWRKLKGIARVRLADGRLARAELHWYEAHGVGKKWLRIKRFLD